MKKRVGKLMRMWKKIVALSLVALVVAIAFLVHSRRISRIDFIQQYLGNASETRFLFDKWGGSPLPAEFIIFEDLQKIRATGYEPQWKDYRYILRDYAGRGEIDPFLWKGNWPKYMKARRKGNDVTRWFTAGYGNYNIVFDNIIEGAYGDGYDNSLYILKLLGVDHITMKDKRFIIAEQNSRNDLRLDFDQVRLRDAAIKYEWGPVNVTEPVLHEYGFIMQKKGRRILVPVKIDTGERFEIPAEDIVIPRAIDDLNRAVEKGIGCYGARDMIPEPLEPGPEVSAKRFLDLCDVRIAWDEASQQYKIAE